MAKTRVTFDVDDVVLFNALLKLGGDSTGIGNRVIMAMMPADVRFMEDVGMAAYGITVINRETIP